MKIKLRLKNKFNHEDIGWNYRMTNLQAAMGFWYFTQKKPENYKRTGS